MTALQNKTDNPIAHLTPADIEQIGRELDANLCQELPLTRRSGPAERA